MITDEYVNAAPESTSPLRVMIVLGGLSVGGAETQAIAVAAELQRMGHAVELVALGEGALRASVETHGIALHVLRRVRGLAMTALPELTRKVRVAQPHVIYAFMEIQWILALAAASRLPTEVRPRIVLGLRTSDYDIRPSRMKERIVRSIIRHLVPRADLLISNSRAGLDSFFTGFPNAPRGVVIPNGIDVSRFVPSPSSRAYWRRRWAIPADAILVGHVGRLDPIKGHELLIHAFNDAFAQDSACYLVCVGHGESTRIATLMQLIRSLGLEGRVHLVGAELDTSTIYPAFDVLALTSYREGFPNVVAEAMSCGVPAVVTNCGASGEIAEGLGEVVPIGSVQDFADGLARLLGRRSAELAAASRAHVVANFDVHTAASRTASALQSLVGGKAR